VKSFSIVEEELVLVVEFKVEVEVLELLFVETIVEDEEKELLLQPKRKKEPLR